MTKKQKRKYPLGGLGLLPQEERDLEERLKKEDLKLKKLQRCLTRLWLKGQIEVQIL